MNNYAKNDISKIKFAVINTWPNVKNAEFECIERLKLTAKILGVECLLVDMDGYLIDDQTIHLSSLDVSFCLALHFLNTKIHNVYTYSVLWNPPRFIDDWNEREMSCNLVSCDDFLCYSSDYMVDFYNNLIGFTGKSINSSIEFVPSIPSSLVIPPKLSLENITLFYSGINWERIGSKKGRHHDLFMRLDKEKVMSIYGPDKFMGDKPWDGFQCYRGMLPFDGSSAIAAINECGASLVLSSNAHRICGAATNRIYESCAAGAVIISDDNPFIKKVFGDSILTFTYDNDHEVNFRNIMKHLEWIKKNPLDAKKLAEKSQKIFLKDLTLDHCLKELINFHEDRKKYIQNIECIVNDDEIIDVVFYTDSTNDKNNDFIYAQINKQLHKNIQLILIAEPNFKCNFTFRSGIQKAIIIKDKNITRGYAFSKAVEIMKGTSFVFAQYGYEWSDNYLTSLKKVLTNKDVSAVHAPFFYESERKRFLHGVEVKRTLHLSEISFANIIDFRIEKPVFMYMFKRSTLCFPLEVFKFLDDIDYRYMAIVLLIESLKKGKIISSNISSILVVQKNVNEKNKIDSSYCEKIPCKDQWSFVYKKYLFDSEYLILKQLYRKDVFHVKQKSYNIAALKKHYRENFPRFYIFLRRIKVFSIFLIKKLSL